MSQICLVSKGSAHKGRCASFPLCYPACNFKFDPDSDFDWSLCLLATPRLVEDVWSISQSAWWALGRGEVWGVGWSCKKWRDVALFPPARVSQPSRWVAFFLHLLPSFFSLSSAFSSSPGATAWHGQLPESQTASIAGWWVSVHPFGSLGSHQSLVLGHTFDSNRLVTVCFNIQLRL